MKRNRYVDIVKGICILCVLYAHINIITQMEEIKSYFNIFIYQFFLTAFYIISGFYLKNLEEPKKFFSTKIKKWYVKLIIYYLPFVLLHNVFIYLGLYDIGKVYGNKVTILYGCKDMIIKSIETFLLMGREPLLGAMWFFISQIIALMGLSIVVYILRKISLKHNIDQNKLILIVLMIFLIISAFCTEVLSITIPRISIAISIMILIYIGYCFNNYYKVKWNSKFYFIISLLVIICNTFFCEKIQLNENKIVNPVTFLASAIAGIYMLCFIGKKIEDNILGKILGVCGRYSFYIMVFHLLSFKLAIILIQSLGIEKVTVLSDLEPYTANILGFIIYIIIGAGIPIIIGKLIEYGKLKFQNLNKKEIIKLNEKVGEKNGK